MFIFGQKVFLLAFFFLKYFNQKYFQKNASNSLLVFLISFFRILVGLLSCRVNYVNSCSGFLFFLCMFGNDRGYGLGRSAGVFAVALREGECGRKTCKMHVSQQVCIGVCWQLAVQSLYSRHLFLSN